MQHRLADSCVGAVRVEATGQHRFERANVITLGRLVKRDVMIVGDLVAQARSASPALQAACNGSGAAQIVIAAAEHLCHLSTTCATRARVSGFPAGTGATNRGGIVWQEKFRMKRSRSGSSRRRWWITRP